MLNLMEWIGKARDELRTLLNPEHGQEIVARGELRSAGVAGHRIDVLYPLDPFVHVQSAISLLHDIEFISLLHAPLEKLDMKKWAAYAPGKANEVIKPLHVIFGVDNSEMYFLAHGSSRSAMVSIRPGSRVHGIDVTEFQRTAISGLLLLPSFLDEFSRYPFTSEAWDEAARFLFEEHAAIAEVELGKVLNLIRIYNPLPARFGR